jgi:2,4-dienoyl-CoA reductase-like NADH-dependent reductase (Old Yellow Enzyme family)
VTDRAGLAAILDELAPELGPIETAAAGDDVAWSAGGVTFAELTDRGVELRLDPAIAAAASHTPDTDLSMRGPEWIRFHPRALDDHAIDRLEAWFALAVRRATQKAGPP